MMPNRIHLIFGTLALLVIGTAVVWGFVIVGSPATARLVRLDERRVDDLRSIDRALHQLCIEYVDEKPRIKAPLPESLEKVAEQSREQLHYDLNLHDPQAGEMYGYRVMGEARCELCATFSLPRDERQDMFWNHSAGRQCFSVDLLEKQ